MRLFGIGFLAFCTSFALTPIAEALSWRIGAVDVPKDGRRMHHRSVARAGGISIFVSFLCCCLFVPVRSAELICTVWGGLLLFLVGLADDIRPLGAWSKLLLQLLIVGFAVSLRGDLTGGALCFGILWVLLLTNAHNLIDGLDGLFCGCAAIEGGALCLLYLAKGEVALSYAPLILSLSCFAFRFFNRHPACLFAGDCGSATVGFLLGMLSLPLLTEAEFGARILSPLFLFAYPITELLLSATRRLLQGRSPFSADRGHLHHRLCSYGLTQVQSGGILLLICFCACCMAFLLGVERMRFLSGIGCICFAGILMRIRRFLADFA
ncbi:MAG: undecaprenyl/decaprenyl-phosphate alpha-N-acetylglucosaminyl 1-phosphate transferase [Clostridia bacterium]|nr:undecaprenyl/decaprenyl-phosphate alpha-N-acetylglucosaminyl 1-phosphate transferase [Clostridia bacterium]